MKATKKPITIDYFPFERKYHNEIMKWGTDETPLFIDIPPNQPESKASMCIKTLEGNMYAREGRDIIIKGINNEIYPCKKDIFYKTYNINK